MSQGRNAKLNRLPLISALSAGTLVVTLLPAEALARVGGGQSYGGPTSITPHFAKLVDLQSAGDFEAVASWYAGMSADGCVRVFTLKAPDRLVIDLQH